jgi:hypothetical protein
MGTNVKRHSRIKHLFPVGLQVRSIVLAVLGSPTARQGVVRGRHDKLLGLFSFRHRRGELLNAGILGHLLAEQDLERVEGKERERAQFEVTGKIRVETVELETGLEEFKVVISVVFMVASDHDYRNRLGSLAKHHHKSLVIKAIVRVEIVANISTDHEAVDLLLAQNRLEQIVERNVLAFVLIQRRPVRQGDQAHLPPLIGYVSNSDGYEIHRERYGVGSTSVPAEHVVVEDLLEVDGDDRAFMDVCLVVIDVLREVQGSDRAFHFFQARFLN